MNNQPPGVIIRVITSDDDVCVCAGVCVCVCAGKPINKLTFIVLISGGIIWSLRPDVCVTLSPPVTRRMLSSPHKSSPSFLNASYLRADPSPPSPPPFCPPCLPPSLSIFLPLLSCLYFSSVLLSLPLSFSFSALLPE